MIQIRGQYQLADYKAAIKLHSESSKPVRVLVVIVMIVSIIAIAGAFIFIGLEFLSIALIPSLILIFVAIYQYIYLPRQIERVFTQQKEISDPFEMVLDDEGITLRNSYGFSSVPWKNVVKWKQGKEILILYKSDVIFHMLPRRLFQSDSDFAYAVEKLRSANVPHASKVRNPLQIAIYGVLFVAIVIIVVYNYLAVSR